MATINALNNKSSPLTVTSGNMTVTSGNVVVTAGNVTLTDTDASATTGVVTVNSTRFMHNYGTSSVFLGKSSGNLAANSYNVGIGDSCMAAAAGSLTKCVGIGFEALKANNSGGGSSVGGYRAGLLITSGSDNSIWGAEAGSKITTSNYNTAVGRSAFLGTGSGNTAIGWRAHYAGLSSGNYNICIGYESGQSLNGATESNNIMISNDGSASDANTIRIGTNGSGDKQQNKCYIAGIYGVTPAGTLNIAYIDSNHQLGSVASIGVTNGGTGAATLTDHGILVGSGTSAVDAMAAGTAGQIVTSGGASADPAWTTATYPATISKGEILHASADNTITALTAGTANYVLTAHGAGSAVTWEAAGAGGTWLTKSDISADTNAAVNYSYTINHGTPATLLTVTLPGTCAVGDRVEIVGNTAGMWSLVAAAGDTIKLLGSTTSAGGSLTATTQYDCVEVVCTVADTTWVVCKSMGNLTVA